MQRREFPIPMGVEPKFPHQDLDFGPVNPGPSSYPAFGTAFGNMIGQAADVSNSASRTPIVERLTAVWLGKPEGTVIEGTLLRGARITTTTGVACAIAPITETFAEMENTLTTLTTAPNRKNLKGLLATVFSGTLEEATPIVLMNDLFDVTAGSTCHIGAAMQSSTVVRIPKAQATDDEHVRQLAQLLPGDPLYVVTGGARSGQLITTADFGKPSPKADETWHLLGYVTVPPLVQGHFGGSHLQVSLVPLAR